MTFIKNLASVLFLASVCLSFSVSRAEVVTVPLSNGLSVTVTTGDAPLQYIKDNPAAQNITMGDDSFVQVPLDFTFPYFGQNFTTSYMYSNGGVGFSGQALPGNLCCNGLNLTTLNNSAYNYTILPLWSDLIAIEGGSHFKLGTSSSMTYGWYEVSEFYNPNKRSTFEVKIDNTGLVDIRFSGAIISSHAVTSGFIGDITKGEYYQYYNGNGFNPGPFSLTLNGIYSPPPTYPPQCDTNPLYSTQCPGYAEALARSISSTSTAAAISTTSEITNSQPLNSSDPVIETAVTIEQLATPITTSSTPVQTTTQTAAQPISASSTNAPTMATSSTAQTSNEERRGSAPNSLIMSIIKNNQTNLQSTEKNAVDRALKESDSIATSSIKDAESIAKEIENQTTALIKGAENASISSNTLSSSSTTSSSQNSVQTAITTSTTSNNESYIKQQVEQEVVRNETFNPVGRNIINDYLSTSPKIEEPDKNNNKKIATIKNNSTNELAVGVDIAQLQKMPPGFDVYSIGMKDNTFYAPKEIYKNQKVIDNQRVLRQLNARSDRLHEEMVKGQFLK